MRQKRILLGFVETMNLIDEDDGSPAHPPRLFRGSHDVFDFPDTGQHCAKRDERRLRHLRDDLRQSRFAHAWRAPEDHRRYLVPFDCGSQWFAGIEQMALTKNFIERLRPHAVGERSIGRWTNGLVVFEKRATHCILLMAAPYRACIRSAHVIVSASRPRTGSRPSQ